MGEATQKEVKITYETLYEIARREKNRDEMQKLPDNFIAEVVSYLKQKEKIVNDSRKRFDLFSASEREKTETQLKNIRKLLKELYEKRESKILSMALNKSRTNTNLIDLSALLSEERLLFDALVLSLNNGREGIVHNILQGRTPEMIKRAPGPRQTMERRVQPRPEQERPAPQQETRSSLEPETIPKPPETPTKSIKFTDNVPKFVGAELEEYGPFSKDEQKTLPEEIADVLIAAGKAVAAE